MNVTTSPSVKIALRTLGEEDRRRVTAWFDHLKNWDNDEIVRSQSHRLASDDSTYLLRTSSDMLIFFTIHKDGIEILDIARGAVLQAFDWAAERSRS
jgi:hypothetical protein